MARGWESKAVESQIESNQERAARLRPPGKTPEEIAYEREIDGLKLSRSRVLTDIGSANNPGYRAMLERSLAFLDEKLKALETH